MSQLLAERRSALKADTGSIWDRSHPFAAALCKPWFPRTALAAFVVHALGLAFGITVMVRNGAVYGQHLRLTIVGAGDADAASCISALGLMRDGCLDPLGSPAMATWTRNGASLTASYSLRFSINGWYLVSKIGGNCSGQPPARFVTEISPDGISWKKMSASSYRWTWAGMQLIEKATQFNERPLKLQCAASVQPKSNVHEFDVRPPLFWGVARVATGILQLLMVAMMIACAIGESELHGRSIASPIWAACAVIDATSALIYLRSGGTFVGIALVSAALAGQAAGFAVALALDERYVRLWCGAGGPLVLVALAVHYGGRVDLLVGSSIGLENRGMWESLFLTAIFLTASCQRMQSRRHAEEFVAEDRRR